MHLLIKNIERKVVNTPKGREPTAVKVGIQVNEYGNKWLGCFETEDTKRWAVGSVIEVESIAQNGKYLNLVLPRAPWPDVAQKPAAPVPPVTKPPSAATADVLALLRDIAVSVGSILSLLERWEKRMEQRDAGTRGPHSEDDFRLSDDVRLPSGGTTEDRDDDQTDHTPLAEESPDNLPF